MSIQTQNLLATNNSMTYIPFYSFFEAMIWLNRIAQVFLELQKT